MKITGIKTYHVKPRWLFLKVFTDEGITVYGEPVVEGKSRTVETAVREYSEVIIGQDPLKIEALWQRLYRGGFYRGGPILTSALSGIEMALWDIKGKYYSAPVYELLGGAVRDKIRMYTHIKKAGLGYADSVVEMGEIAARRAEEGLTAMKYSILPPVSQIASLEEMNRHVAYFAEVRKTVGPGVDIAIDFHGRVSPAVAKRLMRMLEPYCPFFIEEPCLPENVDEMVDIARSSVIPVATGERLFTRWGYRDVIIKQAAKVLQPDLCHTGGIFEARKIAAMAEIYYMTIAPHNPLGPISLAACLQLDACTPNFLIQEYLGMPEKWDLGETILKEPFVIKDGYIDVPKGPGLGIELDDKGIEDKVYDGKWPGHFLQYEDGGYAEW
ncbi:MAG: galactonate dehydratase [Eubacteriales bacterium]|nr:galactonate dehydratase [Eubacteriales bacterium]